MFSNMCLPLTKPVCEGLIHKSINDFALFAMALAINLYVVFKIERGLQLVIKAKVPFLGISDKLLNEIEFHKESFAKIALAYATKLSLMSSHNSLKNLVGMPSRPKILLDGKSLRALCRSSTEKG